MGNDLTREVPLIPMRAVPDQPKIGPRRSGTRLNIRTVMRWATRGASGVVLETLVQGGQRYTTGPALERFFAAVTTARSRQARPSPSAGLNPDGVEVELDRLGI